MTTSKIPDEIKLQFDLEVDFIVYEMERFHNLALTGATFKEQFGEGHSAILELTADLRDVASNRKIPCGRKALRRFHKIGKSLIGYRSDTSAWDAVVLSNRLRATFLTYLFA